MGAPMAKNLLTAGHSVVVLESSGAYAELAEAGAAGASSAADLAADVEIVITMLPNSPEVREVVLGPGGVVEGAHAGLIVADMSSIDPLVSREVSSRLAEHGVAMLDAPVSGGEPGAIAGALSIMVGGPEDVFEVARPAFEAMGKTITRVGEIGAGNIAKLANQAIVAAEIGVIAEALVLAQKAGADPRAVFEAVRGGLAGSAIMEAKVPMMLEHRFVPGFKAGLHMKDLTNVMATSHAVGSPMPITAAAFETLTGLRARGLEDEDHSAMLRVVEAAADTELGAS